MATKRPTSSVSAWAQDAGAAVAAEAGDARSPPGRSGGWRRGQGVGGDGQAVAGGVDHHVALQAVGQREDRLAAGVLEGVLEGLLVAGPRAQRVGQQVGPADARGEVVGEPAGTGPARPGGARPGGCSSRTFERVSPTRSRLSGSVRPGVVDVAGDVEAQPLGQLVQGGRQVEQQLVQRRAGGGGDAASRRAPRAPRCAAAVQRLVGGGVRAHAVGVKAGQGVPDRSRPSPARTGAAGGWPPARRWRAARPGSPGATAS